MPNPYPTVKQALSIELIGSVKAKSKAILLDWKSLHWKGWRDRSTGEKNNLLKALIRMLAGPATVHYITLGGAYLFINRGVDSEIQLEEQNPSVISTLHEVAHAIFGDSELYACAFSLQLFKEVFPKDFANLHADGHMMKKP